MREKDIPEFLFRGAIVSVDGVEKVVKDLCLAIPEDSPKFDLDAQVLVLQFKSGEIVQYDPNRVEEVHGRAPDFIRVGAEIFWRETRSDMKQYNGVWKIESYEVGKDPLRGDPHTKVELSLKRQEGQRSTYLRRAFNANTMYPVKADAPEPDLPGALKKSLKVLKPITFKGQGKNKGAGPKVP